ncbi:MAG TPA: glycine--tRNA ligase subunit beta [Arenimonas sp.]|uniref:glycine--tRNA ligase subunit beta n=1 Tax=Arenimonas sp. TaxID=1872635 RepID=UPI002B852BE6|nr:glycine--tRNA ligase subunit beta [Arenimonas sp.]HMB57302.1 glycine--tRNA ligase subunit beta [Arenimonas sp.]
MSDMKPLLIEIGTEELPPKALPELAQALFDGVLKGLASRHVKFETADGMNDAKPLYTPRRLALLIPKVSPTQPTQYSEVLGPYMNVAHDENGLATPALTGFAQKNGMSVDQLGRTTDAKGARYVARITRQGSETRALLPAILAEAIKALPIPKPMRWGEHEVGFVRPAHWLVMLLGRDVCDGEVLGLKADRMTRGHRFHNGKAIWLNEANEYVEALRTAKVLVDPLERRRRVRSEIERAAKQADGIARIPEDLLEEVNNLVEWPSAVLCGFEPEFLQVPAEALITTMESNQKFFPVLNAEHKLTERFIGIANIESSDVEEVRKGYERVIRPRFADAKFFFEEDKKQGIDAMAASLTSVTYQQKLGSYADKCARTAKLAEMIARDVGADPAQAREAALLSKADLQSRMVGEFPELQGVMGRYYATAAGKPGTVADAIDHAYLPRFSGDAVATSKLGQVLAVADRIDTLVGGFAAGLKPTGNKDPFALRRNALGLARTLIEGELDLDLEPILGAAITQLPAGLLANSSDVYEFVLDRLRSYYADKNVPGTHFDAVAELRPTSLLDFDRRLKAVGDFARKVEAKPLAAANKRIGNILRKTEEVIPTHVDAALLSEPAEQALHVAIESAIADTDTLLGNRDYVGTLQRLANLRSPVDAFFDGVMVMADDPAVRSNRLALLKRVADRFATVAAVDQLAPT